MKKLFIFFIGFIIVSCSKPSEEQTSQKDTVLRSLQPATIILDASLFLDNIPRNHMIINASENQSEWLFNNTGLVMTTQANYLKFIDIPETGNYHVHVRSQGRNGGTFRIAINGHVIEMNLGTDSLQMVKAGEVELISGKADIRIMRIENKPLLDVIVLTRNTEFAENDLRSFEGHSDVELIKEFEIPETNVVKFGDLDGDGLMDFVVVTPDYSVHAYDHSGKKLWNYIAPEEGAEKRSSFEAPGLVWDLDNDGKAEVIHWREHDGKEWLTVAQGSSGEILMESPWPTRNMPHEYYNFRLAVARFSAVKHPAHIIVLTDMDDSINVSTFDQQLQLLWQYSVSMKKDHLGHYIYPVDLNNDGIDEILVGPVLLNHKGEQLWNKFDLLYDHRDHPESYDFADINGDGKIEIIGVFGDAGVMAIESNGGKVVWQNVAEHAQQLAIGRFLKDWPGPQTAVGAKFYSHKSGKELDLWSQVKWFDKNGICIRRWPGNPINGNPVFVKGDWEGNHKELLFWYKFRMTDEGKGVLYFPEPVYHMLDFMNRGAEEIITLHKGIMRVYGYKHLQSKSGKIKRDIDYKKRRVANHSHYGNG